MLQRKRFNFIASWSIARISSVRQQDCIALIALLQATWAAICAYCNIEEEFTSCHAMMSRACQESTVRRWIKPSFAVNVDGHLLVGRIGNIACHHYFVNREIVTQVMAPDGGYLRGTQNFCRKPFPWLCQATPCCFGANHHTLLYDEMDHFDSFFILAVPRKKSDPTPCEQVLLEKPTAWVPVMADCQMATSCKCIDGNIISAGIEQLGQDRLTKFEFHYST